MCRELATFNAIWLIVGIFVILLINETQSKNLHQYKHVGSDEKAATTQEHRLPLNSAKADHRAGSASNVPVHQSLARNRRDERAVEKEIFKEADTNGNGLLSAHELWSELMKLGEVIAFDELMGYLKQADFNGDNNLDFNEFFRH